MKATEYLPFNSKILQHGKLNEQVLLGLKMTTSLYQYIQVVINFYEDKNNPRRITWSDVEGMGYGWRWADYPEEKWHNMMSKIVSEESNKINKELSEINYLIYQNGEEKVFHFISERSDKKETIVTFSNKELNY